MIYTNRLLILDACIYWYYSILKHTHTHAQNATGKCYIETIYTPLQGKWKDESKLEKMNGVAEGIINVVKEMKNEQKRWKWEVKEVYKKVEVVKKENEKKKNENKKLSEKVSKREDMANTEWIK